MRYIFWDYLRLVEIGNWFRGVFDFWNYCEIVFFVVEEYFELIRKGMKFVYNNEFYVICLDVMFRIIRDFNNGEVRIYYISEVFDGEIYGVWEVGVELIGGRELDMYVEVLSVLIIVFELFGIEDFYIDVGSVKVWEEVMRGIEFFREEVRRVFLIRNFGIIEFLLIFVGRKRVLWRFFNFRGKRLGVEKFDVIVEFFGDERVFLDFGIVRLFFYYIDVIFEVYFLRFGKFFGGGGEYLVGNKKVIGFVFDLGVFFEVL